MNSNIQQLTLKRVLEDGKNIIIVLCKEKDSIIGIAMLATYVVISGYKGIIEDVVVDTTQRGRGISHKLMETLISEGQRLNLSEILLFSGHHRKPAIALYKNLGFNLKNSGMYTLKL